MKPKSKQRAQSSRWRPVFDLDGSVICYASVGLCDFIANHYGPKIDALANRAERAREKKERKR